MRHILEFDNNKITPILTDEENTNKRKITELERECESKLLQISSRQCETVRESSGENIDVLLLKCPVSL